MCCRDLQPFSMIEDAGFRNFLLQNAIIKHIDELPTADAISRSALNDIYDATFEVVRTKISQAPYTVSMTADMWTDNYRRRSYITFTLHFYDCDYNLQSLTLRTALFDISHTGEHVKNAMDITAAKFGLVNKKIVYVTDNGANIVKACRLAKVERAGCIAHALHNLITHDGIANTAEVQDIVAKARELVKTFTYKTDLLLKEGEKVMQENLQAMLYDDNEGDIHNIQYGDDPVIDNNGNTNRLKRDSATTLKKDCPTRWNSVLTMLQSVVKNRENIERCLAGLRLFTKLPSDDEWQLMKDICDFLLVLSGSDYTTSSVALLFRADCASALQCSDSDNDTLKKLKNNMREKFDYRFPITEIHVCAAMLDPSQRNLSVVQEYLLDQDISGVHFLNNMIQKFVCEETAVNATDELNPVGNDETEEPTSSQVWKKAQLDLISKHAAASISNTERELQQFRCLSAMTCDDVARWWQS